MPRRDWSRDAVFVVFGLVLVGFNLVALLDLREQQREGAERIKTYAAEDHQKAQYDIVIDCDGKSGSALVRCVGDADAAEREQERSHEDLEAQKQSARAAYWMIAVGMAQTIIGVGGLVFVLHSIDASRDAHRNEQRPWVKMTVALDGGFNFEQVLVNEGLEPAFYGVGKLNLTLDNAGVSPALAVQVDCAIINVFGKSDRLSEIERTAKSLRKVYETGPRDGEVIFPNSPQETATKYVVEHPVIADSDNVIRGRRAIMPVIVVSVCYTHSIDRAAFQTLRAYSFKFRGRGMDGETETHVLYLDDLTNINRANIALTREPGASRAA